MIRNQGKREVDMMSGPLERLEGQIGVGGLEISERARRYLLEVIDSNRLSYGPFSKKFEELFAKEHGCRYAIFCNSGTSALHAALQTLKEHHGWADGDEVLVPAITFVATANVVVHNRMKPVLVDVNPYTYNIDPLQMEHHITSRTRAVIPVHLMGLPADMTPIREIAARHKLSIIEDSCETMFAEYEGQQVGSMGDIGAFSTYVAHLLVTGVGGLATTNDPDLAIHIRSLCNHGRDSIYLSIDDDHGKTGDELFYLVQRRFQFVHFGHSMRCTEMEAALGLAQLEEHHEILKARRTNAEFLNRELSELSEFLQLPTEPKDRSHVYMLYPLLTRNEDKWGLVRHLEDNGVETRDLMPLTNQPIYRDLLGADLEDRYPVAKRINQCGFYIGCHQYLRKKELEYVVECIRSYFSTK